MTILYNYIASENGYLTDLGFVTKKMVEIVGFITPHTNVNTDIKLYFEQQSSISLHLNFMKHAS